MNHNDRGSEKERVKGDWATFLAGDEHKVRQETKDEK